MQKRIVTQTGEVWLGDDGILRIEITNPREHTLADAIENVEAGVRAGGGVKRAMLSRVVQPGPMTNEARAYYASPEAARGLTALAMVTSSVLGRIVANLLMGLNTTPIPMRLFSSEQAALQWIRGLDAALFKKASRSSHPNA
jgi:hypothetical protein